MSKLYLTFVDADNLEKKVLAETEDFFIGRHSDNDLSISNPKLSRTHAKIERYDDVYMLSDYGSSNGTKLNDFEVIEQTKLKDGDIICLGDEVFLNVEFSKESSQQIIHENLEDSPKQEKPPQTKNQTIQTENDSSLKLFAVFAVSSLFLLIAFLGVAAFLLRDKPETANTKTTPSQTDDTYNPQPDLTPEITPIVNKSPTPFSTQTTESIGNTQPVNVPEIPPTQTPESGLEKTEAAALSFMRKIAADSTPVLTTIQTKVIDTKMKQYRGSSVLASNIKNARQNSSEIASLAASSNLKPQFLATAALAQLGNRRGNILAEAKSMIEVLSNVYREVGGGHESANDSLLTIAAYDTGKAGNERRFRDMISRLTRTSSNSPRQIRTIWFLKDKGKLSNVQFDFALRFLAIGAITQNPKAFNVNTTALILN